MYHSRFSGNDKHYSFNQIFMIKGINLLPLEQRSRELAEEKERERAKEKYNPQFSIPAIDDASKPAEVLSPEKNLVFNLKKWLQNRQDAKALADSKIVKPNQPKPEIQPIPPVPNKVWVAAKPEVPVMPTPAPKVVESVLLPEPIKDIQSKTAKSSNAFTIGAKVPISIDVNLADLQPESSFNLERKQKIIIAISLFVVLAVIIGGWSWWLKQRINQQQKILLDIENNIKNLQADIAIVEKDNGAPALLQERLLQLDKKLESHVLARKIFDYLEANTVVGVYYESINVNTVDNSLSLNGVALDYTSAAKQILVFNQDKENILQINLSGIKKQKEVLSDSQTKDKIEPRELIYFSADILLKQNFFNDSTIVVAPTNI